MCFLIRSGQVEELKTEKGKPGESRGRKAMDLKQRVAMVARLPVKWYPENRYAYSDDLACPGRFFSADP